jgi:hypothetical protein
MFIYCFLLLLSYLLGSIRSIDCLRGIAELGAEGERTMVGFLQPGKLS